MLDDLDWKQPAVIGGLIVGVFSAIPGVSALNCCFCAWALIGGAVAVSMTAKRSPRFPRSGEAAQIGLWAGAVAALTFLLLSIPILISGVTTEASLKLVESIVGNLSNPELESVMEEAMEEARSQSAGQRLLTSLPFLFIQAGIYLGFTVLGSLLTRAVRRPASPPLPPPPPPAPNYFGANPTSPAPGSGGYAPQAPEEKKDGPDAPPSSPW